jgi:hypothetical protein
VTATAVAQRLRQARPAWTEAWRYAALTAYGACLAVFAVFHFNDAVPDDATMEGIRAQYLSEAIQGLKHGLPLLVGWETGAQPWPGWGNGYKVPVGIGDDVGLYIYGGLLGNATGESDPHLIVKWLYVGCMAALVLVMPLVFYALFRHLLAAALAPLLFLVGFGFLNNTETYWITAWTTLFVIPLVGLIALRRWTRWSIAAAVAIAVFASALTTMRVHTGLPVVLALAGTILVKAPRWRTRLLVVAAVAIAYVSVYPLGMQPIFHQRDQALGHPVTKTFPTEHVAWHNAYIGLGYLRNPYGIYWLDEVGFDKGKEVDPSAIANSRRYVNDMRSVYFHFVIDHPAFTLRTYWAKTRVLLINAFDKWKLLLLLLPLVLVWGRHRRTIAVLSLLALPSLVLTYLPPLLTVPAAQYAAGFYATIGFYWILSIVGVALLAVEQVIPALVRLDWTGAPLAEMRIPQRLQGSLGGVWPRAALVVAFVGLCAIALYRPSHDAAAVVIPTRPGEASGAETALTPADAARGTAVATWRFAGRVVPKWALVAGATAQAQHGRIVVRTGPGKSDYALVGPATGLPPGTYRIVVAGDVKDGGVGVGALDLKKNRWLGIALFGANQNFAKHRMVTGFQLTRRTPVEVVLTNYRDEDAISSWVLRSIEIQRLRR